MPSDHATRRLLLINNGYPDEQHPARCGYMLRIHRRLVSAGFDVQVVTLAHAQTRLAKLLAYGHYWVSLAKHLRSNRFDVTYAHHVNTIAPVLWVFHPSGKPLWVHWHGSELRGATRLIMGINRVSLSIARRLQATHIAPSAYFAREVATALQCQTDKIRISPSGGLDPHTVAQDNKNTKTEKLRLGFAGHLTSTKGFPAMRTLVARTAELEAALKRPIEWHMIRHHELQDASLDHVSWHSPYLPENMPQFYRAIDLLISPSEAESLGLTTLEALWNDCPVIAPDRFAFGEFVKHGVNGLLYDTAKPNALFSSIVEAANTRLNPSLNDEPDSLKNYRAESVERFYASL
ncbi:MAG: glycosyltransferase family 4 protein [Burkholderiaceae bacterium]